MTTHQIVVPTPYNDITELAENFASRVDEERLMLPHWEAIAEGEWVQFVVTLGDESTALAGTGRCGSVIDNGEDRAAEHRFDIVLDSIELDGMAQVYFDRILQARAAQLGFEPPTGEVSVPVEDDPYSVPADLAHAAAAPPAYDAPYEEPLAAVGAGFVDDSTMASAGDEVPAAWDAAPAGAGPAAWEAPAEAAPAEDLASLDSGLLEDEPASGHIPLAFAAPEQSAIYEVNAPVAPAALPTPFAEPAVLTRRALMSSWSPEPLPRRDPGPASGYFQYAMGAGLPIPAEPPRPALDPALRILRAPRPGDPHHVPSFGVRAAAAASAAVAYGAAADYGAEAAGGEYAADGEYAEDGYEDGGPYDGADVATREVNVAELPDEEEDGYGADETVQVGLDDDEY